jgi:hypothetical protein
MSADRELPPGRLSDLRLAWAGSMRRARLRREIEILRYRLAVRIGGRVLREADAEAKADRESVARMSDLIESYPPGSRFAQSGAQALFRRMLHAPLGPAEPVSPVSTPTETPGGAGETQEGSHG